MILPDLAEEALRHHLQCLKHKDKTCATRKHEVYLGLFIISCLTSLGILNVPREKQRQALQRIE